MSESRLWLKDLASGELRRLPVPAGDVEAIAWTTDGARLLVTRGQQIDLVDASAGTLQSILAVARLRAA